MHNIRMDKYAVRRKALRALIDEKYHGVNASFAKAVDIADTYVSRMLYPDGKDGRKRIGEDTVEKINKIHPDWLVLYGGIGSNTTSLLAEQTRAVYGNIGEKIPLRGRVPLIGWVEAGNWSDVVDNYAPGSAEAWIDTTVPVKRHTYALKVQGDSMEPRFPDGVTIIIEPEEEARNGSYVIVRQNGSDATFKQLVYDGSQAYLKPINSRYPIMQMAPDAVICGVVKQMIMDV